MTHTTSDARISPVFRYRDAAHAIDWLSDAYGFVKHEVHQQPDGTVAHAELRLGSAAVGLSSAGPEVSGNPWTTVRQGIYVCLADVDGAFRRVESAGVEIAQTLRDTDYGSREFSARDLRGHLWSFGTYGMAAPEGRASLFVGLHYADGRAAIDSLRDAFGFTPGLEVAGEDGAIEHAELRLGRDYLMIGSAPREQGYWRDQTQCTYVWVEDVDGHHRRAVQANATIVQDLQDTTYGSRAYYTSDPEGFLWSFGTYRPQGS